MNLIRIIVVCLLLSCILQDIHSQRSTTKKRKTKSKVKKNKSKMKKTKPLKKTKTTAKPETLEKDVGPVEWNPITNAVNMRWRIIQLGRAMVDDTAHKMLKHNKIRAAQENTPYYEIGYVFSEIVEKYRKLVELVRRNHVAREDMFRTVSNLETAQSIYFEMFHLVNMLHEIPRKYFKNPKYQELVVRIEGLYLMDDRNSTMEGKGLYYKKIEDLMEAIKKKRLAEMKKKREKKREEEMKNKEEERPKKPKNGKIRWQGNGIPTRPHRQPKGSGRWPNFTYGWEPAYFEAIDAIGF